MSDSKQIALPPVEGMTPDAIAAQEITDLTTRTIQWVEYGQRALDAGYNKEAAEALLVIRDNLIGLLKTNCLTPAILQAQAKALEEAMAQYGKLARRVDTMNLTFDKQVHEAVDEFAEHIYTCEACFDDVFVEGFANEMLADGVEAVKQQQRDALERRLAEAEEVAQEWSAEEVDKPGIASGLAYELNPDYPGEWPDDLLDDDGDEDPDLDLLDDGDDDADEEN